MPETVLTDDAADAERMLNGVLGGSLVRSVESSPMGWIIHFELSGQAAAVLGTRVLRLEHSCEESVQTSPDEPWISDIERVETVLRLVPGKAVESVRVVEDGELCIRWQDGVGLRLLPADYSMDWQWQIAADGSANSELFSVTSVHGGKVWTRYPRRFQGHDT